MKTRFLVSFLVLGACADGTSVEAPSSVAVPDRSHPDPEASLPPTAPPPIYDELQGTVVTDLGEPIVGRAIVVVDARGRRTDTKSFEGGEFRVPDVATPYDLAIAPAPVGDVVVPTVLLGISRIDPYVELFERNGPVGRPPSQRFLLAIAPPRCAAKSCVVTARSASPNGSAVASLTYAGSPTPILMELEHEWSAPFVPGGETIDVHALTSDADRTSFAYAVVAALPASPGEIADLGTLEPTAVDAVGPMAIAAAPASLPSAWKRTLAVYIDLPGGAALPLFAGPGASLVTRVPAVPGATVRAVTWGFEPLMAGSPSTYAATQAWSGAKSIASTAIDLDPQLPPSPVRPERDGALSRRGAGIAWSGAGPALATVTIVDVGRNVMRLRAVLTGEEIAIAQLVTLGLARLEPGPHVLDIVTSAAEDMENATSPDAAIRRRRFDPLFAGAATHQRYPFTVTP